MNTQARTKHPRTFAALTAAVLLFVCWPAAAVAAQPDFVGVLAVIVEDEVAKELELTKEQKDGLKKLIAAREDDWELTELVLEVKDLAAAEREAKLAPFRSESEELGLALLSDLQRDRLEKIRIRRAALAGSVEPSVAEQLGPTTGEASEPKLPEPPEVEAPEPPEPAPQTPAQPPAEPPDQPPVEPADQPSVEPADEPPLEPADEPTVEPADEHPVEPGVEPAVEPGVEPGPQPPGKPAKLRFNFRYQPWKDVLDWFAQKAELSLVLDSAPPGTFNYTDDRDYTPAEAIDLINSVLLTKGYTLVRRDRMLMLFNLEEGIPPNVISTIPLEELDKRGEFELVGVLFQLERLSPEEVEEEIKKLVGPQGSVIPLPMSRAVHVTETAGRLRSIRKVIERIEHPEGPPDGEMRSFDLKFAMPEELLTVIRQLLEIPEDKNAATDGSLHFALDPMGERLLATGKPEKLARIQEIIDAIDVPGPGQLETEYIKEEPQLEVYSVTTADPAATLAVMQTLLAGMAEVRLAIDPKTGNLVALARPSQQKTIRATLDQLQKDARRIEVIRLYTVDAQLAVLSINKLFGAGEEGTKANAPQVDADPTTGQLLIRATEGQIEQIRTLLEKMGESDTTAERVAGGGNVRLLPLKGQAARSALERLQEIWPTMRENKIRIVTPYTTIPTIRPGSPLVPPQLELPNPVTPQPKPKAPPAPRPQPEPLEPVNKAAGLPHGARVFFAAQTIPADPPPVEPPQPKYPPEPPPIEPPEPAQVAPPEPATIDPPDPAQVAPPEPAPIDPAELAPADPKEPAVIVVAPGPGGVMIASSDIEALDEFEQLLNALAGNAMAGGPELTIFYLKYAKAGVVAETLDQIFGGGTLAESSSGGGGLIGDIAGAAMGEAGGGILGSLLGLGADAGGTITPSGAIRITPDPRLNALVVQANPIDLDTIEQLLKILDQKEPPDEVLAVPKAKVIRIINTQAEEIAEILQQVYQDRLATGGSRGGGEGQRPSPEEFFRMLRGGSRGGRGGSSRSQAEEVQKMSLSVDTRTNSLIIAAPEPLLEEVEQLVKQLDQAAIESNQATRVVTLKRASPEAVQQALSAILGDSAQFGRTATSRTRTSSGPPPSATPAPSTPRPTSSYRPGGTTQFVRPPSSGGSPRGMPGMLSRPPTRR